MKTIRSCLLLCILFLSREAFGQYTLQYQTFGTNIILEGISGSPPPVNVIIPDFVTGIANTAFLFNTQNATNITIGSGVTSIGLFGFTGSFGGYSSATFECPDLISFTVSAQNPAFSSTNGVLFDKNQDTLLQYPFALGGNYTIPGSVTNIGGASFEVSKITSVTIPTNVITIGLFAFSDCANLTSITIPDGVTSIGLEAFDQCANLDSVTIGNDVTNIGSQAFGECPDLASINVGALNPAYSSTNNVLFDKNQDTLVQYPSAAIGNYTIPNGVITIAGGAFSDSAELTAVTVPASVTNIGNGGFIGCSSLTNFSVSPQNSAYSETNGVLFDKKQDTLLQYPPAQVGSYSIPDSVVSIGPNAFTECTQLSGVIIPTNVAGIGSFAFYGCTSLTSFTIPSGLTSIATGTFSYCTGLTSISIPIGVMSIGGSAFLNCSSLTNMTIPNSVTNIGEDAFSYCDRLATITIPGGITSLPDFAFISCPNLTGVFFEGRAPSVDSSVFASDSSCTAYYLPSATGWSAFSAAAGIPAVLWNPTIHNPTIQSNGFAMIVTGTTNIPIQIAATTDISTGTWTPLQTCTLTNGSTSFSDPGSANYPTRFYTVQFP